MTKHRPFAVFDIDGTVIRWQLYHAIADALARAGHIKPQHFKQARQARMRWKQRTSDDAFKDYEATLIEVYEAAFATLTIDNFMEAVQAVFDEYKEQTYTYTRDLIRSLQQQNYLLFAISASQEEIVATLAQYYGFDAWAGSTYGRKDGKFTGEKVPLKRNLKVKTLHKFVKQFDATYDGSLAIGDSDSDIPMLAEVSQPIAFNPDKALFRHAKKQGWKVVIERKNMIYELEPRNGSYILA